MWGKPNPRGLESGEEHVEVIREFGGCRLNGGFARAPRWGIGASSLENLHWPAVALPEGPGGVRDLSLSLGIGGLEVFRPTGSDLDLGSRNALFRHLGSTLNEEGHPFRTGVGAVPF